MSNLPTKTMIKEWIKAKKWKAVEMFSKTKKTEIALAYIGTETEENAKEWDESILKMRRLYQHMVDGKGYGYNLSYRTGQYLETMVDIEFDKKHGAELGNIKIEFDKILRNVDRLNSPKQMLEYLKSCEMEYPLTAEVKQNPDFAEVDVTVYKPWIQNQLSSGQS